MKENFTTERIERFTCPKGKAQALFRDAKTPGLGVRITSNNAKTFIYESKLFGKTIRISIGSIRSFTIPQAREKANSLTALINVGTDPRDVYRELEAKATATRAQESALELTVQIAWDQYIQYQIDKMAYSHIEKGKKWGKRHLLDHQRLASTGGVKKLRGEGFTKPGALAPILKLKLSEIDLETLRNWQRLEASERPNVARQAYEAFRSFWRWCSRKEAYRQLIDQDAIDDKELRDEVPSRKSKSAGDAFDKNSLKAWFTAVRSLENKTQSALLQVLLLTGARRGEICPLKWSEIDFRKNIINLRDKVEADGRKVPLTPYVKQMLCALPRFNEYVFYSPTAESGYIVEPRSAHSEALRRGQLEPVSIHGLRRTFATLAEWNVEMPAGIVAQIMGHKPSATAEKHYKVRPLDLLALWHSRYEAWILEIAEIVA